MFALLSVFWPRHPKPAYRSSGLETVLTTPCFHIYHPVLLFFAKFWDRTQTIPEGTSRPCTWVDVISVFVRSRTSPYHHTLSSMFDSWFLSPCSYPLSLQTAHKDAGQWSNSFKFRIICPQHLLPVFCSPNTSHLSSDYCCNRFCQPCSSQSSDLLQPLRSWSWNSSCHSAP